MLTAADVMTTDLKTVFETDDLAVAWDLMEDGRFRHLPVVDEDGRSSAAPRERWRRRRGRSSEPTP